MQALLQFRRQAGAAVFHHDVRLPALVLQADAYRLGARGVAHGVVDQVGQCAFDELQVAVEFHAPGWRSGQRHAWHAGATFELLHRVGHQLVQAETLAVQHLPAGVQRGQFEQLLRQAAHLVALRQRCGQHPLRLRRASGQRFQLAVQRGQRGAQIVGHAGHHFAVGFGLLLLTPGLGFDARGQGVKGLRDGLHFVTRRRCRRVGGPVVAVVAHAAGHALQGQRQAAKAEQAQRPGGQQTGRCGRSGALPHPLLAELRRNLPACPAVEHDVQIARRVRVARPRREHRGAEDAGLARAHRVGAMQGQFGTAQKAAYGVQVHLRLAHHAGFAQVGVNAAARVQDVDLHAGVHHHQHLQQRVARGAFGLAGVGHGDLGPVAHDVPRQAVRQALQRLLFLLRCHLAAQAGHQCAVAQQQGGQRQGQTGGDGPSARHGAASS